MQHKMRVKPPSKVPLT